MKFKQYIKSNIADDMIVLVQPLNDDEIIIFDRKGRGEIWSRQNAQNIFEAKHRVSVHQETCIDQAVSYTDENDIPLILSHSNGKELYITNINTGYESRTIKIESKFRLIKYRDKVYIAVKNDDKAYELKIVWGTWRSTVFEKISLDDVELKELNNVKYYHVKSISDYTWKGITRLSDSNFDLSSVPKEHEDSIISKCYISKGQSPPEGKEIKGSWDNYDYYNDITSIFCYCVLENLLICGHDGRISVWSN